MVFPIFANTLSAIAWLQVMSPEVLRYQHNPIIDRIMKNRDKKGIGSMVFRLGDWLQASLDNNKYNIFGRYGIMEGDYPCDGYHGSARTGDRYVRGGFL